MDGQANKLTSSSGITRPRVALFVTCLVDLFRPSVAFAAIKLLEDAGCTVEVPAAQTCCGQPAYNSGDQKSAYKVVSRFRIFLRRMTMWWCPAAPVREC